jgi:hypothetical protein
MSSNASANIPSGAKARVDFDWFMYGLKPVPFSDRSFPFMYGLKPVPFSDRSFPQAVKLCPFKATTCSEDSKTGR